MVDIRGILRVVRVLFDAMKCQVGMHISRTAHKETKRFAWLLYVLVITYVRDLLNEKCPKYQKIFDVKRRDITFENEIFESF